MGGKTRLWKRFLIFSAGLQAWTLTFTFLFTLALEMYLVIEPEVLKREDDGSFFYRQ